MTNRFDDEKYLAEIVHSCRKRLKKKSLDDVLCDIGYGLLLNKDEMITLRRAILFRKELV